MSTVFLITGSSRGLGRAIAEAALHTGHHIVATARRPEQLADLAARHGDRISPMALDVTDFAAAEHAVEAAVDTYGRLDVVVNNAGYADLASVEDMTIDAFRAQIDTNLLGVVNVTKAALPVMRKQRAGHIIQISSLGGRIANPGLSAYQAAKFAVGGFSEALAQEVSPLGIKVTVLEPGGMRTDWAGGSLTVPPISEPYGPTVGVLATSCPPARPPPPATRPRSPASSSRSPRWINRPRDCCSAPTPSHTPPAPHGPAPPATSSGVSSASPPTTTTSPHRT